MSLVNLALQGFLNKEQSHGDDRFALFATYLSRRLTKVHEALEELGLVFEAGEAKSLADRYRRYVEEGSDPEDFADLWNDLSDWGGSDTEVNGRSKVLCNVAHLPDRFAC